MKFKKEDLLDLLDGSFEDFTLIHDKIIDNGRWTIQHELVFKFQEHYYRTYYQVGATEYQDEGPFEYEADVIDVEEVFPVEKTIIVYKNKKGV